MRIEPETEKSGTSFLITRLRPPRHVIKLILIKFWKLLFQLRKFDIFIINYILRFRLLHLSLKFSQYTFSETKITFSDTIVCDKIYFVAKYNIFCRRRNSQSNYWHKYGLVNWEKFCVTIKYFYGNISLILFPFFFFSFLFKQIVMNCYDLAEVRIDIVSLTLQFFCKNTIIKNRRWEK